MTGNNMSMWPRILGGSAKVYSKLFNKLKNCVVLEKQSRRSEELTRWGPTRKKKIVEMKSLTTIEGEAADDSGKTQTENE